VSPDTKFHEDVLNDILDLKDNGIGQIVFHRTDRVKVLHDRLCPLLIFVFALLRIIVSEGEA